MPHSYTSSDQRYGCGECEEKIHNSKFKSHLRNNHRMTYREYFFKHMTEEKDTGCPQCGKVREIHKHKLKMYCSVSCRITYENINLGRSKKANLERCKMKEPSSRAITEYNLSRINSRKVLGRYDSIQEKMFHEHPFISSKNFVHHDTRFFSKRRKSEQGDLNIVMDFTLESHKLRIEIDGHYHSSERIQSRDRRGDSLLKEIGWTTIRIPNSRIDNDIEGCVEIVREFLSKVGEKND